MPFSPCLPASHRSFRPPSPPASARHGRPSHRLAPPLAHAALPLGSFWRRCSLTTPDRHAPGSGSVPSRCCCQAAEASPASPRRQHPAAPGPLRSVLFQARPLSSHLLDWECQPRPRRGGSAMGTAPLLAAQASAQRRAQTGAHHRGRRWPGAHARARRLRPDCVGAAPGTPEPAPGWPERLGSDLCRDAVALPSGCPFLKGPPFATAGDGGCKRTPSCRAPADAPTRTDALNVTPRSWSQGGSLPSRLGGVLGTRTFRSRLPRRWEGLSEASRSPYCGASRKLGRSLTRGACEPARWEWGVLGGPGPLQPAPSTSTRSACLGPSVLLWAAFARCCAH